MRARLYRIALRVIILTGLALAFPGVGVHAAAPDLVVDSITWQPAQPLFGDRMTFTVVVSNQGQAPAGHFHVAYYVDDTYVNEDEINGLAPGATISRTFYWTAQPGQHTVRAVADYQYDISEANESNNEQASTFSTLGVDLTVQSITWSPAEPAIGDTVTFSVTVKNLGSIGTGSTRVYFSIDGASQGYQEINEIGAGASVTRTFTWYMKIGPHVLTATVDKANTIKETNEANNETTVDFSPLLPDLAIGQVTWSPQKPSIGDNVTFMVFINNQGQGESSHVVVDFYTDGIYHSTNSTAAIEPGSSANVTFEWNATRGAHSFKINAAMLHTPESDLSNNVKTVNFATYLSDLVISTITPSKTEPALEEYITFAVTVKNQGEGSSGSCRVYLYVDGNSKGYQVLTPVSANGTGTVSFEWKAEAGSHLIRAMADALDQVPETNEYNNEKTISLSTLPCDLIIEDITWSPEKPDIGDTVTFTVGVRNQGEAPADYSYLSYYIDGAFIGTGYVDIIAVNTTANQTFTWTATAGEHVIRAIADANTRVVESDETNNEETRTMPSIGPDLAIDRLTWSHNDPVAGDRVAFTVTIKNRGNNRTEVTLVHFYIDDVSTGYQDVPRLDAGAEFTASFDWVAQADPHTIRAVADSSDTVEESDETNNERTIVYPMPDLTIATIEQSPESPVMGEKVSLSVQVTNQGSKKAGSSLLQVYVDDVLAEQQDIPEIEAGSTVNRTFTWTAQPGEHTINVLVDGAESVAEWVEDNNRETLTVSIPAPDLVISDVTWAPSENITTDNIVAITVTVKNLGNTSANPFYISFHLNDEYLPYGAVAMLRPNAVTEETFNLFIGEAGSHDVRIILDRENSIAESDEMNNSRTVTFSIAASPNSAGAETPTPSKSPGPRPAPIQLNPDKEESSSELIFFVPVLLIVGILVFTILRARRKM